MPPTNVLEQESPALSEGGRASRAGEENTLSSESLSTPAPPSFRRLSKKEEVCTQGGLSPCGGDSSAKSERSPVADVSDPRKGFFPPEENVPSLGDSSKAQCGLVSLSERALLLAQTLERNRAASSPCEFYSSGSEAVSGGPTPRNKRNRDFRSQDPVAVETEPCLSAKHLSSTQVSSGEEEELRPPLSEQPSLALQTFAPQDGRPPVSSGPFLSSVDTLVDRLSALRFQREERAIGEGRHAVAAAAIAGIAGSAKLSFEESSLQSAAAAAPVSSDFERFSFKTERDAVSSAKRPDGAVQERASEKPVVAGKETEEKAKSETSSPPLPEAEWFVAVPPISGKATRSVMGVEGVPVCFPHSVPLIPQLQVIQAVIMACNRRMHALLESPTGR